MNGHWPTGFRVTEPVSGDGVHQIRLHFVEGSTRTAVDCSCGARAGMVLPTSGTEVPRALHRAHVAAVSAGRAS